MQKSIYWDINECYSFNALFNFIVGLRGGGKTYGTKVKAIENFLKDGSQFAYVRRYREEYKDSARTFFNDVSSRFPDHKFEVKGNTFFCDGMICGYGFVLSTSTKKKSMSFPLISLIIFDEFMLDPQKNAVERYLPKEVETFLNLYETIARMRDVKVFFLANALSWVNPYFVYFKIERPFNKRKIKCKNDVLIQLVETESFKEVKKATRFGKIISSTEYEEHAVDNKFIRDNDNFICKPFPKMRYFFTLKSRGELYGVYVVNDEGALYVSRNYEKGYYLTYVAILDNHEPNMLLTTGTKSPPYKKFVEMFKSGCVYYDHIKTKSEVFEIMKGR